MIGGSAHRAGSRRPATPIGCLALGALLALGLWLSLGAAAPGDDVLDAAGLLDEGQRARLGKRLRQIERESGVDVRVALQDLRGREALETFAARVFDQQEIGRESPEGRGLLFVYDTHRERLRLEVGYDLESLFPDSFADRLLRDHARHLFRAGQPEEALRFTLRLIALRLRSASLDGSFDPHGLREGRLLTHGSGGAGATRFAPIDGGDPALPRPLGAERRMQFGRAPSVEDAIQSLVDWIATGTFDAEVALFTEASRALLAKMPMTPGYLEQAGIRLASQQLGILERGDLALAYSRNDPLDEPIFLRRQAAGWQIDLAAAREEVIAMAGGAHAWTLRGGERTYALAFADHVVPVDGTLRFRGGDNRPIPLP